MLHKFATALAAALIIPGPGFSQAQSPRGERPVTVSAIPGIVEAGAQWTLVWFGTDDADGIAGTPDGGVIFAQREVNRVRKIDPDGKTSVVVEHTGAAGSLAVDYQGRILAVLRDHPSLAIVAPEHK